MHCWRMREEILDIFEKTTGGRIIHSVNRIGGVKRDISDSELAAILVKLQDLGTAFRETARVFGNDPRSLTGLVASAFCPRRRPSGRRGRSDGPRLRDRDGHAPKRCPFLRSH